MEQPTPQRKGSTDSLRDLIKMKSFNIRQNLESTGTVTPTTKMVQTDKLFLQKLIARLAKTLFIHGAPTYSVESRIQAIANAAGIKLEVIVNVNSIFLTFGDFESIETAETRQMRYSMSQQLNTPQPSQTTVFLKCTQVNNMERLHETDYLTRQVAQWSIFQRGFLQLDDDVADLVTDRIDNDDVETRSVLVVNDGSWWKRVTTKIPVMLQNFAEHFRRPVVPLSYDEALGRLEELSCTEDQYPLPVRCIAYASMAASACVLIFNGTVFDGLASFLFATVTQLLISFANRYDTNTMELWIPCLIYLLVSSFSSYFDGYICKGTTLLPSILYFYPGISITTAMMEMAAESLQAGTVRIFNSFLRSLKLGFGLSIGARMFRWMSNETVDRECIKGSGSIYTAALIIPFAACACVSLRGNFKRQYPVMLLVSIIGYTSLQLALQTFSRDLSSFISAFMIGLSSNLYARLANDIAIASSLAGIMLIVPGSVGVAGFYSLMQNGATLNGTGATPSGSGSTSFAIDMLVRAMSIGFGLFISTKILYPVKKGKKKNRAVINRFGEVLSL